MKKISSSIYENLTPSQRIIASVEAAARGDDDERQRLIKTCPKLTYRQTDATYSDVMEKLMVMAMAVECDLRGYALSFLIVLRVDTKNAIKLLQPYANLRAAWESTITQMGIDAETMRKAGPPPCPILELIEVFIPKPNAKKAENLAAEMRELIGAASACRLFIQKRK